MTSLTNHQGEAAFSVMLSTCGTSFKNTWGPLEWPADVNQGFKHNRLQWLFNKLDLYSLLLFISLLNLALCTELVPNCDPCSRLHTAPWILCRCTPICLVSSPFVPQVECHLVLFCSRRGTHLHNIHFQNSPNRLKQTEADKWHHSYKGKYSFLNWGEVSLLKND